MAINALSYPCDKPTAVCPQTEPGGTCVWWLPPKYLNDHNYKTMNQSRFKEAFGIFYFVVVKYAGEVRDGSYLVP